MPRFLARTRAGAYRRCRRYFGYSFECLQEAAFRARTVRLRRRRLP
ncbi:hypothetical protein HMPREF0043_02090 [Actinobaculum sp. oral taxon 183 str. F0552]|nr:hypothetical protein HMPREF0043_02090 [Actinobaculum sp. oral taxon 183 str. F0552]